MVDDGDVEGPRAGGLQVQVQSPVSGETEGHKVQLGVQGKVQCQSQPRRKRENCRSNEQGRRRAKSKWTESQGSGEPAKPNP